MEVGFIVVVCIAIAFICFIWGEKHGMNIAAGTWHNLEDMKTNLFGCDIYADSDVLVSEVTEIVVKGQRTGGVTIKGRQGQIVLSYWQFNMLMNKSLMIAGRHYKVVKN